MWLKHGKHRQMCRESLYSQASIHTRRQKLVYPAHVLAASFHAAISDPQRNHGDESHFLLGNQHEASRKTSHIPQGSRKRSRNRRLHAVRLLWLGHKIHAQGPQTRSTFWLRTSR